MCHCDLSCKFIGKGQICIKPQRQTKEKYDYNYVFKF